MVKEQKSKSAPGCYCKIYSHTHQEKVGTNSYTFNGTHDSLSASRFSLYRPASLFHSKRALQSNLTSHKTFNWFNREFYGLNLFRCLIQHLSTALENRAFLCGSLFSTPFLSLQMYVVIHDKHETRFCSMRKHTHIVVLLHVVYTFQTLNNYPRARDLFTLFTTQTNWWINWLFDVRCMSHEWLSQDSK